ININNLTDLIKDKQVVDLGCGNGVFCFALIECGAQKACGIDFGANSIQYAQKVAEAKNLLDKVDFRVRTVYETSFPDSYFDFAVQNGVFHHLDDEDRAIREAKRILKPGGWFWYYTAGESGIQRFFWDISVEILKDVPVLFIEGILTSMNVSRNKIAHLSDGLSATYSKTNWQEITTRLADNGFGNFKRLTGGFSTDFDQDRIDSDPFGKEKFGEGDLRILCQLTNI
ncbi:MAG TPA: class I SAM-dependent methyltransferase, partial [Methanosarcina sp.]|nr:class I SAM-dependent methyltransferase [Methanosarcina sp.]